MTTLTKTSWQINKEPDIKVLAKPSLFSLLVAVIISMTEANYNSWAKHNRSEISTYI